MQRAQERNLVEALFRIPPGSNEPFYWFSRVFGLCSGGPIRPILPTQSPDILRALVRHHDTLNQYPHFYPSRVNVDLGSSFRHFAGAASSQSSRLSDPPKVVTSHHRPERFGLCLPVGLWIKRIEDGDTSRLEIRNIARHHDESMLQGCPRDCKIELLVA